MWLQPKKLNIDNTENISKYSVYIKMKKGTLHSLILLGKMVIPLETQVSKVP